MKPSSESNLSISSSDADADADADNRLEVLRERGVLFPDCPRITEEDAVLLVLVLVAPGEGVRRDADDDGKGCVLTGGARFRTPGRTGKPSCVRPDKGLGNFRPSIRNETSPVLTLSTFLGLALLTLMILVGEGDEVPALRAMEVARCNTGRADLEGETYTFSNSSSSSCPFREVDDFVFVIESKRVLELAPLTVAVFALLSLKLLEG